MPGSGCEVDAPDEEIVTGGAALSPEYPEVPGDAETSSDETVTRVATVAPDCAADLDCSTDATCDADSEDSDADREDCDAELGPDTVPPLESDVGPAR